MNFTPELWRVDFSSQLEMTHMNRFYQDIRIAIHANIFI